MVVGLVRAYVAPFSPSRCVQGCCNGTCSSRWFVGPGIQPLRPGRIGQHRRRVGIQKYVDAGMELQERRRARG